MITALRRTLPIPRGEEEEEGEEVRVFLAAVHAYMNVHTYVCIYVHMYVHTYVCTYI